MFAVNDESEIQPTDQPTDGDQPVSPTTVAGIVEGFARALELHDYRRGAYGETSAHTDRVMRLALELTAQIAPELVDDPQLAGGFRLHDIGMIAIPTQVMMKPGQLTPDELSEIREHPWLGERIVAPIGCLNGLARQVIACHHERFDGSGYPRGLRQNEIPLAARIFAVVDAYDSMTNVQPYRREPLAVEVALAEIDSKTGTHFDPDVVAAFLALQVKRQHPVSV
jgi:HD-GYP domain-containing protein (c-di-GMP phosphodiesterase class II)